MIYFLFVQSFSVHHFCDHFALNGAVLEILAVEVLRSIAHSVACVADYWQLHFVLVWHTQFLQICS